jgi:tRNA 2-selenouridine synthase
MDLEGMAAHRGSLLGGIAGGQPAQKTFESRVAMALARLDPARPVFVEAESNKIGRMILPPSLWQAMMVADHVRIDAPLTARARYLTRAYADLLADVDLLCARLAPLKAYHGAERIEIWQTLAREGAFEDLAADLVARHYDPRYVKAQARGHAPLARIALADFEESDLDAAVSEILAVTGA